MAAASQVQQVSAPETELHVGCVAACAARSRLSRSDSGAKWLQEVPKHMLD